MSTYERARLDVEGDIVHLRDAGAVRFDRAQTLTEDQKATARANIGAGGGGGGTSDYDDLTDKPAINGHTLTGNQTGGALGLVDAAEVGAAGGVAELDSGGKVPAAQLPGYVDDVVEYASASGFPATGETGKIYVDTSTNKTWRWGGSAYVEISPSLALGETSATAYRGDRGKAAYDHAAAKGAAYASGLYKITTNAEGHVTAAAAAAKADITALGIPGQDTTYDAATQAAEGLMSAADKQKLDGIAAGAQVNSVTGVKGNVEGSYRTGNVNLTPGNIGAKGTQAAVSDPAASGTAVAFIASISQNAQGVISPTKKTVANASTSAAGLMSASDKQKLDGISDGVLAIDCGTVSSLPKTISNSAITADMVVVNSTIGTPAAQRGDWTVTTSAGSLTVSGTISGSTTLKLYLCRGI